MSAHDTPSAIADQPETWKPVPGFPGYEVSDAGRVRSLRRRRRGDPPRMLRPCISGHHYYRVFLVLLGRTHTRYVHRLVLEAFLGPCPEGLEACHRDDDQTNNRLSNLRWDTRQANDEDRERNGGVLRGSRIGNSKLSEEDVQEIRRLRAAGWKQQAIAARFHVSRPHVSELCAGKKWAHVG